MKVPKFIDIDLTTECQLRCDFCPYHSVHNGRPREIDYHLLNEIIDQINWKCSIKLCQYSEPLLAPLLWHSILRLTEKGLRTVINTNGLLLDKCKWQLIRSGIETIILSDYGLGIQLENGKKFDEANKRFYKEEGITVEFIIKTERPEVWKGIGDLVITPIYYDHSGNIDDNTELPNWKCEQLFERLIIRPNGDVDCCCGHLHPQKHIGNVKDNTILEIWNSNKLNRYRQLHLEGNSHKLEMCKTCDYRRSIIKNERNKSSNSC